jgi:hypothetical protein
MWLSRKGRILFAHNPRTAGTSMITAFKRAFDDFQPFAPDPDAPFHVKDHSVDRPPNTSGLPVVAAVRNPYARELSFYFWRRRQDGHGETIRQARRLGFKEYMRWRLDYVPPTAYQRRVLGVQSRYLLGVPVDVLIRYEDLPEAFTRLPCVRQSGVVLPRAGQTVSPAYRLEAHYDDETTEWVRLYAAADFLNFGYDPFRLPVP